MFGRLTERLREEPFFLFFGLGLLFGWLGVSHWLLYGLGLTETYSGVGHAALQLECFELAFAAGFLYTALPRRTGSPAPSLALIGATFTALVVTAAASLLEQPGVAALGYLGTSVCIAAFALPRLLGVDGLAKRRPPATFVLVPIGLLYGVMGAIATSGFMPDSLMITALGFDLVRQGVFFCLTIGIGSLILPLVLGYAPPPDVTGETRAKMVVPALLGLAIGASIVVEHALGQRLALSFRGLLVLAGLVAFAGIHRRPAKPGIQRWVAWVAAWCVPVGAMIAGLAPDYRIAFLHVTFVSGFGLLTFAIGSHVLLGHTGRERLRDDARWTVLTYAVMMLLAAGMRVVADYMVDDYFRYLAYASALWLVGTLGWLVLVTSKER